METPYQASLTPEQLDAINASGGFARGEDPKSHVLYHLIQFESSSIDDEYVRQKIEEAYADADENGFAPLDMTNIKAELNRRLVLKQAYAVGFLG